MSAPSRKEYLNAVGVIEHHHPWSVFFVAQPGKHQLEHVALWIISSGKLQFIGDVSVCLFETGYRARMHPENPGIW